MYTIAKRLSHGECVRSEWTKQSKRLIPLLPRLEYQSKTNDYYRILADHIVAKSRPILNLYPEPYDIINIRTEKNQEREEDERESAFNVFNDPEEQTFVTKRSKKKKSKLLDDKIESEDSLDMEVMPLEDDKPIIYLANGYGVDSKSIKSNYLSFFGKFSR